MMKHDNREVNPESAKGPFFVCVALSRNLGGVRITGRKPGVLESRLMAGRHKELQYKGGVNVVEGKIYK